MQHFLVSSESLHQGVRFQEVPPQHLVLCSREDASPHESESSISGESGHAAFSIQVSCYTIPEAL